jgi:apolipoprotein N-acyltransferase
MTAEPAALATRPAGLVRLGQRVAGLTGWRRHALAIVLGACATAAFAPLFLVPLLIPAFTGLVWLVDGARRPRTAFAIGWSFGFGHMATGLSWIGLAFLVDAERFGALMPVAVALVAIGIGLFPGFAVLGAYLCGWRGPARIVWLAVAWLAVEWLRSWVLTGFPWNLVGNVWVFWPPMIQLAALTGVWGLSLVTVLAAAAPALLADPNGADRKALRARYAVVAGAFGLLVAAGVGGAIRLAGAPPPGEPTVPGVRLRLVQASIAQSTKWEPKLRREHVIEQMRLTVGPGFDRITDVIWPETAVPFLLDGDEDLRRTLGRVVPPGGVLITGAPRGDPQNGAGKVWNSVLALDPQGEILAIYDKHHLVPFGEYVPLRSFLGIDKLAPGNIDFSAGPGPVTISLPGLPPFSPLICYEAIFPGQVVAPGRPRPAWMLNVTNDAWFGTSLGPYQHFASARMRAVEEGLPMVRAANTGISAVVDGYGRVVARLGLNRVGVLDAALPQALPHITLYADIGTIIRNWSVALLVLAGAVVALILRIFFK